MRSRLWVAAPAIASTLWILPAAAQAPAPAPPADQTAPAQPSTARRLVEELIQRLGGGSAAPNTPAPAPAQATPAAPAGSPQVLPPAQAATPPGAPPIQLPSTTAAPLPGAPPAQPAPPQQVGAPGQSPAPAPTLTPPAPPTVTQGAEPMPNVRSLVTQPADTASGPPPGAAPPGAPAGAPIGAPPPGAAPDNAPPARAARPGQRPPQRFASPQRRPFATDAEMAKAPEMAEKMKLPTADLEVFFAFDSAEITPEATGLLDMLGEAMADQRLVDQKFVIAGHTDAKGRADYNIALSQRRAEAVRQYVIDKHGIDPANLIARGFGRGRLKNPRQPFADENRRVQIINWTSMMDAPPAR